MRESLREPAVAGRFYPANPERLRADIQSYLPSCKKTPAIACLVPHAGYMYSGQVAAAVFSRLALPASCIVLGPNHTGRGHPLAIMNRGAWRTPLGEISVDCDLAEKLILEFPALSEDSAAHRLEHSIEVEIPFLQVCRPDIKFVPIAIGTGQLILLEQLGQALAEVLKANKEPALIVGSSDMNHYEDNATTRVKDRKAIDKILALDAPGLYQTVMNESISMCGFGPAVAMLTAARRLGAQKAELVQYATSADVSGDHKVTVGYAGIIIH
ncbi:MAG TPA: AmmeMemoRadiSam system protein B [Terriglobales bacterium]|nr:AmmeMemoRadiSam system protein B [Terriglobales bacterium]